MEKMQKNPEKWMSRLESQMNDSSEEESEESNEESEESEESEKETEENIVSKMIPENSVYYFLCIVLYRYVNGISWKYEEESFRDFFKEIGEIKTLFLVRQNNGKISGYG